MRWFYRKDLPDVLTEQRKYFQMTLGIAIVVGILWYGSYLSNLIKMVKGA